MKNTRGKRKLLIALIFTASLVATATAQNGITLYDGSDINANNNSIKDLQNINPNGELVYINASQINLQNNNISNISQIQNFFNQNKCGEDEAIKTIYPNGSYACNQLSTTTEAEGLSETLRSNNTANQSVDLNQNGLLDTAFISGGGEAIQINDDLDLGNNKLLFGGGNISGGIEFESDVNLNGNDLEEIGFLNPGGSSTNFGGDLNVGGDRITNTDNLEFSRGIEIGDEDTFTGSKNVEPADNFTVDTNTEWQSNGTINNGIGISQSNLQLEVTGDTYSENFNYSYGSSVLSVDVDSKGNVYTGGSNAYVRKLDSSGNEIWSYTYDYAVNGVAAASNGNVYLGGGYYVGMGYYEGGIVKLDSSGNELWSYSNGTEFQDVVVDADGNVYAAGAGIREDSGNNLVKLDSSGEKVWSYNYDSGVDTVAVDSSNNVYIGGNKDGNDLVKLNSSGSKIWSYDGFGVDSVAVDSGGNVYAGTGNEVVKLDSSGNEVTSANWPYSYGDVVSDVAVGTGGNVYAGGRGNNLVKLDSSGNEQWSYSYGSTVNGVAVAGSTIALGGNNPPGDVISLDNQVSYSSSGDYISNKFDSGSVNPFPEFQTSAFLPDNTDANVTIELSNNSDMSSSVSEKLEIGGGTEPQIIDERARYAQFMVEMSGDTTDTPELNDVSIDYGNTAASYGYNQIALGTDANTNAEGAVAIGYNASSNQAYTVRFGNEQGQEQDVEITGNLTVDEEIQNFFDQNQCADDEAIKTIYPNGSYSCNTISSTTGKQNLSQTLETGNSAGDYNIDMAGESVTGLYGITGDDGVIRVGSDLDLGNNKLIFGGGNISGGIDFNSDILMNGNDIGEIGFLNPSGSSTNFGGNLNVGLNEITGLDSVRFSRGIDLGEGAVTGQEDVQPASSFVTDSNTEWQNDQGSQSNTNIQASNLELSVTGDTLNSVQNVSLSGDGGDVVEGPEGYLYLGSGTNLAKYDKSGNLIWEEPVPGTIDGLARNGSQIYASTVSSDYLLKYDTSGNQYWNKTLSGDGSSVGANQNGVFVASGLTLRKYNSSGVSIWNRTFNEGQRIVGVEANSSSVYISTGEIDSYDSNTGELYKYGQDGTNKWNSSQSISGEIAVGSKYVYSSRGVSSTGIQSHLASFYPNNGSRRNQFNIMFMGGEYHVATDIQVTDEQIYFGTSKDEFYKLDKSLNSDFSRSMTNPSGITIDGKDIFVTKSSPDELKIFENVVTYDSAGDYSSSRFDAGSVQPFSELNVENVLPASTDANVTVELSNASDFSSSVSQKLELTGGTENKLLGTEAQYARFDVSLSGDTSGTPEVDSVEVKYGNSASAYGYNQIALGTDANTNAEGAVAIGYNASSNKEYLARFGNNNGQELSAEVTGNLTVDGELKGVDIQEDIETENLSETLAAGNVANQSIDFDGNNVDNLSELNPSGGNLVLGSNLTLGGDGAFARVNRITSKPVSPMYDSWDDGDIAEYGVNPSGNSGVTASQVTSNVQEGSAATQVEVNPTQTGEITTGLIYQEGSDGPELGDEFQGYVSTGSSGDTGIAFGIQENAKSGAEIDFSTGEADIGDGYELELDYDNSNLSLDNIYGTEDSPDIATTDVDLVRDNFYRFTVDWRSNGTITAELFNVSSGNKVAEVTGTDTNYTSGAWGVFQEAGTNTDLTATYDGFEILSSEDIDIESSVDFENNFISDVSSIDGGGDAVNVDDNLDVNGNNVSNVDEVEADTADAGRVETEEVASSGRMCIGDRC